MVLPNLADIPIILASKSPRRQMLLAEMGIEFTIKAKDVDESFPAHLKPDEVALYIAENKAKAFMHEQAPNELLIAADTVVCLGSEIIGKPKDRRDALEILKRLSGKKHEVITAVSLLYKGILESFQEKTVVYFNSLTKSEIDYYIEQYQPFDKAGAYGIQEWIGAIGIEKIVGSYTNVMGLPTALLYDRLSRIR